MLEQPVLTTNEAKTNTAQMILTLHLLNMQLERVANPWPIPKQTKGTSINQILYSMKQSYSIKQQLNNHDITCIEQFLDYSNHNILNWKSFHHNIQKIPRGKIPKWFKTVTNNITSLTNLSTTLIYPNPYTFTKINTNTSQWVITKS